MCEAIHFVSFLTVAVRLEHCFQSLVIRALVLRQLERLLDAILVTLPEHTEDLLLRAAVPTAIRVRK